MATTFRLKRKLYAWPVIAATAAKIAPKVLSVGSKVVKGANIAGTAAQGASAVKDGAQGLFGNSKID